MHTSVTLSTLYNCSLERAFKTPMLCDIARVHTGFLFVPRITHCTDDEHWGEPGQAKKVFAARSLTQKGGWFSSDKVLERTELQYWKIEVGEFKSWMLGFTRFVGEWSTTELEPGTVRVHYRYTLYANTPLLYPLNWLFTKLFWPIYMRQVLRNIRGMIAENAPYLYD